MQLKAPPAGSADCSKGVLMTERIVGVAGLALACVAFLSGGAAGTSTGWKVQPTQNPSRNAQLNAVSCPALNACTAVGVSSGGKTLAERWNGARWKLQPTPNPSSSGPDLLAVSCPQARDCIAVGSTDESLRTLIEQWTGRRWRIQAAATGRPGMLNAISCSSRSDCTAVGSLPFSGVLAEHWNGRKWTTQKAVSPTNDSGLNGVSCPTPADCTAVGSTAAGGGTFAEQWTGGRWKLQATKSPSGFSSLDAVSCSSPGACTATGYFQTAQALKRTLAERWNGRKWTIQPTPTFTGGAKAINAELAGIWCASAGDCMATGYGLTVSRHVLAEHWNGRNWTVQRAPNPPGTTTSQFTAVSCVSPGNCAAAGYYGTTTGATRTLAERH
jgi:hypothetical protein